MSFCPYCGKALNANDKFCQFCGASLSVTQPPAPPVTPAPSVTYTPPATPAPSVTYTPPVRPVTPVAPVVSTPVYQTQKPPVVNAKAKAFGFVGLGLSIEGLICAILGIFYTFFGLIMDSALQTGGAGFIYAFVFSFFSLAPSIIGRIFSDRSISMGNTSGVCTAGFRLGTAGTIVSIVMMVLGFFSLMAMAA